MRGLIGTAWERGEAACGCSAPDQCPDEVRPRPGCPPDATGCRRARALGLAMEHGGFTIRDYEAACPDTNRRSLQRDLRDMIDRGLLIELGSGPTDPTKRYAVARGDGP